jgi:hypothetical protein
MLFRPDFSNFMDTLDAKTYHTIYLNSSAFVCKLLDNVNFYSDLFLPLEPHPEGFTQRTLYALHPNTKRLHFVWRSPQGGNTNVHFLRPG